MKLALTVAGIWLLLNVIILALRLYATRGRFNSSFGAGLHPLAETETTALIPPGFKGSVVSDNSARRA